MRFSTFRTRPLANVKWHLWHDVTTIVATLTGRVELVDLDHRSPVPRCFVFELPDKFPPAHIGNGLGQVVVLNHVLDLQTLQTDDLVLANQSGSELVQEVLTAVCNLGVNLRDFHSCLVAVLVAKPH